MIKKHWVILILSAILLFHFVNNFMWLTINKNAVEGNDSMWQLLDAIRFQISLKGIMHSNFSFSEIITRGYFLFKNWDAVSWPPLVYLLSGLVNPDDFSFFRTRMYVNFIFYVLLVLSTYFLGKKCFDQRVGLIAAFLVSFYPAVYASSRQFGLDFPLVSMAAACTCLLVYAENFSRRSYTLLFGLCLGLATLVKLQIIFFICGPLIFSFLKIFDKENRHKLKSCFNLFLSLTVAYFLFFSWWGTKLKNMLRIADAHLFSLYPFYKGEIPQSLGPIQKVPASIFSPESITYYFYGIRYQTLSWLFGLFIIALLAFLVRRNKWKTFFLLNLIVPYLCLTFISLKWPRYALPMFIPISIISACFIDRLRFKNLKIILLGAVLFYCLGFNLLSSWWIERIPFPPDYDAPYSHPPGVNDSSEVLKEKGIISHIEDRLRKNTKIKIRYIGGGMENTLGYLYYYLQNGLFNKQIEIDRIMDVNPSSLKDVDYVITTLDLESISENRELLLFKEVLLKNYTIIAGTDDLASMDARTIFLAGS
jgi:Dolichyl-phosphate-mannose-protein mannosyltransferase